MPTLTGRSRSTAVPTPSRRLSGGRRRQGPATGRCSRGQTGDRRRILSLVPQPPHRSASSRPSLFIRPPPAGRPAAADRVMPPPAAAAAGRPSPASPVDGGKPPPIAPPTVGPPPASITAAIGGRMPPPTTAGLARRETPPPLSPPTGASPPAPSTAAASFPLARIRHCHGGSGEARVPWDGGYGTGTRTYCSSWAVSRSASVVNLIPCFPTSSSSRASMVSSVDCNRPTSGGSLLPHLQIDQNASEGRGSGGATVRKQTTIIASNKAFRSRVISYVENEVSGAGFLYPTSDDTTSVILTPEPFPLRLECYLDLVFT